MDEDALYGKISISIAEGDGDLARQLAEQGLKHGISPLDLIEKAYTPALHDVGSRWATGELFLPEMILAAEAVKGAMRVLKSAIQKQDGSPRAAHYCVLGTVKGDIHDIGKSIVASLVEAVGFNVVDLGTDVDAARFVDAIRETNARLLGLSALLTTTMAQMKTVMDALEEAGLRNQVRVAVGGAPLSQAFADEIGADGYAKDGLSAMHLFERFVDVSRQVDGSAGG